MKVLDLFLTFFQKTEISISCKGNQTMTITCEAGGTWSGLPEEPRECEAYCPEEKTGTWIRPEYTKYLQNPDDKAYYDCTDGDRLGSVCTLKCPPGFHQWTQSKYGAKSQLECKRSKIYVDWPKKEKRNWWKGDHRAQITRCKPIACSPNDEWIC